MKLVLDDKTSLSGPSFGANNEVSGEVVFNTGMSGYVETLTDPSYRGQILVLTYPLVGNYGVPEGPFESDRIQVQGLVVNHYTQNPSHYTCLQNLGAWLKSQGVPAITNVDTRSLTRYLREHGTLGGRIQLEDDDLFGRENETKIQAMHPHLEMRKVLELVVPKKFLRYGTSSSPTRILVIDTGAKENILRSLVHREASLIRAPWNQEWEKYLPEVDGIFLTNGPGDPIDAGGLIDRVKPLLSLDIPIFGICFGHQMLALASGAKTFKMKYGHRGVNQPVQDLRTHKCYITSQNHGYMVQGESLSSDFEVAFINLNDGTNEGIRHKHKAISSVQFHPEATPGPHDTSYLFDEFLKQVRQQKTSTAKRSSENFNKLEEGKLL